MIELPEGLHPSTVDLVEGFTTALAEKLRRSEIKYGWSDGWKDADWQDKCLADFNHHIDKGDPRDVAAYCAFMWFHGWQTKRPDATAQPVIDWQKEAERMAELHGMSFVVFRNGDEPKCADPTKVRIEFTDKGLGYPAAPGGQDD